jgi:tRNA dimethylallyltransferase
MKNSTVQKPAVLVICGPTGSGKTALALEIAARIPLEIISADSRQVYRRMDIGTAKASAQEQQIARHHLIDVIDPDEEFSVADFVARARLLIEDITARGKLPCVVGGTGLYIDVLLGGLADLPGADEGLRLNLQHLEQESGSGTLHRKLEQLDPRAAAQIHPRNIVRLVRALEVCQLSGRKFSELKEEHSFADRPYRTLKLAPGHPRELLYRRINERARLMLDAGLVAETEALVAAYSIDLKALQTLGYREVCRYLKGEIDVNWMLEDIRKFTRHYAKRQLTWFRKDKELIWVDSSIESGNVVKSIDNFILQ